MDKTVISEMADMTLLCGFCSITAVRLFLVPFLVSTPGSVLPFVLEERFVLEELGGVIGVTAVAVGHVSVVSTIYYSQVSYCCARGPG
jgi:hypothetical protein